MIYSIWLPGWKPISLNKVMGNWKKASGSKKITDAIIYNAILAHGTPSADRKRRYEVQIHLGPGERKMDSDNVRKLLQDSLVRHGLLKNDSPIWCEEGPISYLRCEERAVPGTMIILQDL